MAPVVIIGGGIGGLGAALALTAAGYDAAVYEAHPHTGADLGAFLTLASNGMRALLQVGAAEPVAAAGFELTELAALNADGTERGVAPLSGRTDPLTRYRCLRRAELRAVLHAEVERRGIPVHHGKRLTGITEDDDGVTAEFADGDTARGVLLVAADGLNSVARGVLDAGAPPPRYAGQRVFYGYTPAPDPRPASGPRITMIAGSAAAFGFAVSPAGETYWFARVPYDEPPADTPGPLAPVLEPLLRPDATPAADLVAASTELLATNAYDLPDVPRWRTSRTILLGDAAHAASPATGQGASMALEDAIVLAKALRAEPVPDALATYERVRRPRVSRNIATSARLTATRPGTGRMTRPSVSFRDEDPEVVRLLDWDTPLPA